MQVIEQLVALRRKKMTQAELARKIGVSTQCVSNFERGCSGSPTLATVVRYAEILGVELSIKRRS